MADEKQIDDKKDETKSIPELEKELLSEGGGVEAKNQDDSRLSPDDADDEGDAADQGGDEATREQRRLERQQRKNRQKMARARSQQELQALREQNAALNARLEALERGSVNGVKQQYVARANQANQAFLEAEAAIAKAMESNDPQAMTKALRVRDEARAAYHEAANAVRQIEAQEKAPPRQQQAPAGGDEAPDPQMVAEYRKFQARNPWYDPDGRDPDSKRAVVIDSALPAEGYDPTTSEYWNELEVRLRRAVPHQYEGDDAPPPPRNKSKAGGPPLNSSRDSAGANPSRNGDLSQARLDAFREASGGDPKKFARLVANAKKFDQTRRTNSASR